ncbi:MAG: class I SAM-dependent methyltransferase [Verrucomicrobiota bacterium]|nr:class I SAM-dependent methyltransferase [Verrucomicrobiota bacterium]
MPSPAPRPLIGREHPHSRFWWHRLPAADYDPPVYSDLAQDERGILRDWYAETERDGQIGECAVPLISLLHGMVLGSRAERIVQLGTHAGYSALLLGFMLRRSSAQHGLFAIDIDSAMCVVARRWIARAGLEPFVEIQELSSLDPAAPERARAYLAGPPELVILDSSHEYEATFRELEIWYDALAPGGMIMLHDVSRFAEDFDVTKQGGVRRAFREWREQNPNAETFCLNGEARSMDLPRPLYKDACGLGLVHKPQMPGAA